MSDEPDDAPIYAIDYFLGPQRITHAFSGMIGIDGQLYKLKLETVECPMQPKKTWRIDAWGDYYYPPAPEGHSRYCRVTTLLGLLALDRDEMSTLDMIVDINSKRIERMVAFHRHATLPLIYAIDESWNTSTSGAIICTLGENPDELHNKAIFEFNPLGYIPKWVRPELDDEQAAL